VAEASFPSTSQAAAPSGGAAPARIPVTLITGFLGSGKTTLVNAILRNPAFAGTLVIVNEFGEVGLDHLLVGSARDQVVLLDSGCLCCAASGSLRDTLIDLFARRAGGAVDPFDRIFVETSGLAHPGPLVAALIGDSALRPRCALAQVLTLVDAVNCVETLTKFPEARHQAAFADQLVMTKVDKVSGPDAQGRYGLLRALNSEAPLRPWCPGMAPEAIFENDSQPRTSVSQRPEIWLANLVSARRMRNVQRDAGAGQGIFRNAGIPSAGRPADGMRPAIHGATSRHVGTRVLQFGQAAMPWTAYAACTRALAARLGRRLLRCKGVLRIDDGGAWVVQGVQGYFAPPERLPADTQWSGHAFLVCIVDDVTPEELAAVAADVPELPDFSFCPPEASDDNHG
jgi:G3E family GTPase